MDIQKIKLLLDYTNYINECVSKGSPIDKNTVKEYLKGSHFYEPLVFTQN